MSVNSLVTAAYSAAKILKSVERIQSLQHPTSPFEDVVVPTATIDEQIHDALEILNGDTDAEEAAPSRVNNVVSSEVREPLPSDSIH